jgi:hypothetical protein
MEEPYRITCFSGRHVHTLDYDEMVKVFGKDSVEKFDADPARHPLYAPSCMECDEDEDQRSTEQDIHELGLEMSGNDGYYE